MASSKIYLVTTTMPDYPILCRFFVLDPDEDNQDIDTIGRKACAARYADLGLEIDWTEITVKIHILTPQQYQEFGRRIYRDLL